MSAPARHPRRLVSTDNLPREEWLRIRLATGIGSSDASAILGYNPYRPPAQAFDEFVGLRAPFEGNEATEWGELLEDDVITMYERRTGNRCQRVHAIMQHPELDFVIANLDRRVVGANPKRLVEAKTAGLFAHNHGDWGDPEIEPDRVPTQYLCQVQHALAVTNYQVADLALAVGGQKLYPYQGIERDETFINSMLHLEADFWSKVSAARKVLADIALAYGLAVADLLKKLQDESAEKALQKVVESELASFRPLPISYDEAKERWGVTPGKSIQATPEIAETYARYCEKAKAKATLEKDIAEEQLALASYMRDADELYIDGWPRLTYKFVEKKGYQVAPSVSRQFRRVGAKKGA